MIGNISSHFKIRCTMNAIFGLGKYLFAAMDGDAGNFLKDLMLAGAAWMYAGHVAKDNSVIG